MLRLPSPRPAPLLSGDCRVMTASDSVLHLAVQAPLLSTHLTASVSFQLHHHAVGYRSDSTGVL